jgi:hypothetical protein
MFNVSMFLQYALDKPMHWLTWIQKRFIGYMRHGYTPHAQIYHNHTQHVIHVSLYTPMPTFTRWLHAHPKYKNSI